MDQEILNMIVKIIIVVASVLITGYFIPWVKTKVSSTKYNDFLSLIEKCVEAANQIFTPEEFAQKKKYVLDITENYAKQHGVNITAEELNALIEGFVKAVKGWNVL